MTGSSIIGYTYMTRGQTRCTGLMLAYCCVSVEEGGPTFSQHGFSAACLLVHMNIYVEITILYFTHWKAYNTLVIQSTEHTLQSCRHTI